MDEQEWHGGGNPSPMLEVLRHTVNDRKFRLFAVACSRRLWHLFSDQCAWRAIEFAELYADGLASRNQLRGNAWGTTTQGRGVVAWDAMDAATISSEYGIEFAAKVETAAADKPAATRWQATFEAAWRRQYSGLECQHEADRVVPVEYLNLREAVQMREREAQSLLLRDIFGNPFRPSTLNPSWRTTDVICIAQGIYDDRHMPSGLFDNQRMGILADALEEAGCDNRNILDHCRNGGAHVKGCHVVDLVMGKE